MGPSTSDGAPTIDPIVNTLVQLPVGVGALVVLYLSFRAFRAEMRRERSLRRKSHRAVTRRLRAIDAKVTALQGDPAP